MWEQTRALMIGLGSFPTLCGALLAFLSLAEADGDIQTQVTALLVGVGVLGGLAGWWFAQQSIKPMISSEDSSAAALMTAVESFTAQMQDGDLTANITLTAEQQAKGGTLARLAVTLNTLSDEWQRMIKDIVDVSKEVESASQDILLSTSEQITNATDQDSSVMQTSSTVQEVRATVTETAERAAAVAEMAQRSVDVSKSGEQAVTDTIEGMNLIRQRVESIADNILVLSEHTQQIGEIISTVSALADQSKLLALNASVEAARAGEEGKGFAVVAMEVRNLAEQSREATEQVRDILSEIQQATNSAVMVTEEGTKGVDAGVELVNRAGESIRDLASTIEEAAYAAIQIAASTRQQTVGMDQLTSAINKIREITAEATSGTMTVERAARDLNKISRQLGQVVEKYRV